MPGTDLVANRHPSCGERHNGWCQLVRPPFCLIEPAGLLDYVAAAVCQNTIAVRIFDQPSLGLHARGKTRIIPAADRPPTIDGHAVEVIGR